MSNSTGKRKSIVPLTNDQKRVKLQSGAVAKANPKKSKKDKETNSGQSEPSTTKNPTATSPSAAPKNRPRIRKLAPPRPFPTVAPSAPATAPRSLHTEGKNNICITRRTKLAAYLRRCKALIIEDGFKEIRLSAMGAAIPHLALLAVSLPQIVPGELNVEVQTGSVDVIDQMLEGSEDEDSGDNDEEFKTRVKSTMNVVIRVGGSGDPKVTSNPAKGPVTDSSQSDGNVQQPDQPEQIVLQEPEQEDMDQT
ncbi:hypothetical protein BDR06DRAFT_963796 [Suillus hirtellus]|nr:hypothetical protein BDR06DRAFT_963796 [Suillus hirtellus]